MSTPNPSSACRGDTSNLRKPPPPHAPPPPTHTLLPVWVHFFRPTSRFSEVKQPVGSDVLFFQHAVIIRSLSRTCAASRTAVVPHQHCLGTSESNKHHPSINPSTKKKESKRISSFFTGFTTRHSVLARSLLIIFVKTRLVGFLSTCCFDWILEEGPSE